MKLRQDAMTSQQVLLTLAVLMLSGCVASNRGADRLRSPYEQRMLWAIAPLRNESGTQNANGLRLADQLAGQLEEAANIDVLPVNRSLAAMNALQIGEVTHTAQAMALLDTLKADALVVGSISEFDPYDPPRLGMAIELYVSPKHLRANRPTFDVRQLSRAPSDGASLPTFEIEGQPVSTVSAHFNAASPNIREMLKRYAHERGGVDGDQFAWRKYRSSMNLYSEFASYVISWRLLKVERRRMTKIALINESAKLDKQVSQNISAP